MRWALALALLLAEARAAPPATDLLVRVQVGAPEASLAPALEQLGATQVESSPFDLPGAFARGLLQPPGMLALLNRVGARHPFFDRLPGRGPTFVTARVGEARAAYAVHRKRVWSMALTLPYGAVRPQAGPFDPHRMAPLSDALGALCRSWRVAGQDEYGNAVAWSSASCQGGRAVAFYEPVDRDAALKVLVYRQ